MIAAQLRRHVRRLLPGLLLSAGGSAASAATLTVGGLEATHPSIQEAIDAARDGDVILVAPGRYQEVIDFDGRAVTVRGSDGPEVTILDAAGSPAGPAVRFTSGETEDAVLQGLTVTGASWTGSGAMGGGILIEDASPLIRDCIVTGNTAHSGGGIMIDGPDAAPRLIRVTVRGNYSAGGDGAGIYVAEGVPEISSCRIEGNRATGSSVRGGGLFVAGGRPWLHNSLIGSNTASLGGGLYAATSNTDTSSSARLCFENNLFVSNNASSGAGHNLYSASNTFVALTNNLFVNGGGSSLYLAPSFFTFDYNDAYNGNSYGSSGTGNLSVDPQFVFFSDDHDYANDDFHLKSGSPLVDAGDPDWLDLDGSRSDIGVYGGLREAADDRDGDGMPDGYEVDCGLDPASSDEDDDADGDGLTNLEEFLWGSDASSEDSDGDGVADGLEVSEGTNPASAADNRPEADAGEDLATTVGSLVWLDGSSSVDPNGDPLTFRWSFLRLPAGSQLTDRAFGGESSSRVSFTPDVGGEYEVQLTVSDGKAEATDTIRIEASVVRRVPEEFATIQAAIDASARGDRVEVAAGTYKERISFKGKAITVAGAGPGLTLLDGQGQGSVVQFPASEGDRTAVLEGFTLRNGRLTSSSGNREGGCVSIRDTAPTLRDLVLADCSAAGGGGGLFAQWSTGTLTLTDVRIERNVSSSASGGGILLKGGTSSLTRVQVTGNTVNGADGGGGIYLASGLHTLTALEIGGNITNGYGGGIALATGTLTMSGSFLYGNVARGADNDSNAGGGGLWSGGGTLTVINNVFSGNLTTTSGGGLSVKGNVTLRNNVLIDNDALSGGNLFVASGGSLTSSQNVIAFAGMGGGLTNAGNVKLWSYNDVYGNVPLDYAGPSQTGQNGNISVDPGFLDYRHDDDLLNDHYNLAVGSPLVDAGDPARQDFDGSRADIGLYGGLEAAGLDFDRDDVTYGHGDCDDWSTAIHPGALELEDGLDNDCDGEVDEDPDEPGDADDDGYPADEDCNDNDPGVYPGALETLDGKDNNCDGRIDEGTEAYDDDGDGWTEQEGDCDDADPLIHLEAVETLDGKDNNCDGRIDEGTEAYDDDGDGWTEQEGDCDDADPLIHLEAIELADGVDNDCDGKIDEGTAANDDDGDGISEADGDCNDGDDSIHPGATELEDGLDNDCDDQIDEDFVEPEDGDGDGFTEAQGDCDDGDETIHPGAADLEDDVDNDCDGAIDEDVEAPEDGDGDGFTEAQGDCDDGDPGVHPGPVDPDNGRDDNCDGQIDEPAYIPPVDVSSLETGCGCTTTGGARPSAGLLLIAVGVAGLLRRRTRPAA